jgi:plastocyanin
LRAKATRKRGFLVALLLAIVAALQFVPGSSAEGPTIEPGGPGSNGYYWNPSTASIGLGGTVTFRSTSPTVPHGVKWTGGPEKPSCPGVPSEGEHTGWSGSCTFAQAGTYTFVCNVHPTEMKGAITVSSTEAPPPPPPPPGGSAESPLRGPASSALKLAKSQHGGSVRGSINLSPAAAGGRLQVLLVAKQGGRVGRLSRLYLKAGRLSFTVPLTSRGRRMLKAAKKLPLTVQIVVTPPGQAALTLRKGVVLHV